MRHFFHKGERLKSEKIIKELISEKSKKGYLYPFKYSFLMIEEQNTAPVKILFVVPKRLIKNATTRNLIRRRIKEAYRKNKSILCFKISDPDKHMAILVGWTEKTPLPYKLIEQKIVLLLHSIAESSELTLK